MMEEIKKEVENLMTVFGNGSNELKNKEFACVLGYSDENSVKIQLSGNHSHYTEICKSIIMASVEAYSAETGFDFDSCVDEICEAIKDAYDETINGGE